MNPGRLTRILFAVALVLLPGLSAGCAPAPLVQVYGSKVPRFTDDLDRGSLKLAVRHSLDYLRRQPQQRKIMVAGHVYPLARLTESLGFFLNLLADKPSAAELNTLIRRYFDVFQATGTGGFNPGRKMLVTGYYQPVFSGSLTRQGPFQHPLYSVPDDLVRQDNPAGGKRAVGRIVAGHLVPYWTRREIELLHKAAGHELVWLKDPFEAFILQVQGSGLIRLQDGSLRGVHFAAGNGRRYRSIGRYLVATKRLTLAKANMTTIRDYIAAHPGERDEILNYNKSFIFFKWSRTPGAVGSLGEELTAGRSIAVDLGCFPAGALGFLVTRQPAPAGEGAGGWTRLKRLVLAQDTGSAIRGPGRVDLFWGAGPEAGRLAGRMKETGSLYFLLLRRRVK
ncbi:membrane-bound lytic murein transglycosylase A precursor [bacterium BMS3Abin13]|nr:membrane-bound lytic murein transglycosylase A precursor [bacterium BMS3Abin13]